MKAGFSLRPLRTRGAGRAGLTLRTSAAARAALAWGAHRSVGSGRAGRARLTLRTGRPGALNAVAHHGAGRTERALGR
ncbi:hypothetical protein ACSD7O_24820 [Methylorubrum extorquens]|uniref:hypothetical protein n=1 Tax=Methylorubrum extorquens TaxID=408 RepID=UPI003F6442E1